MSSSIDAVSTLAHGPGTDSGLMLGVLLLAVVIGFVAGLFFERAAGRKNRDRES